MEILCDQIESLAVKSRTFDRQANKQFRLFQQKLCQGFEKAQVRCFLWKLKYEQCQERKGHVETVCKNEEKYIRKKVLLFFVIF
jgi:hypothetical protein